MSRVLFELHNRFVLFAATCRPKSFGHWHMRRPTSIKFDQGKSECDVAVIKASDVIRTDAERLVAVSGRELLCIWK
jgi:hypothetical protein